MKKSSNLLDFFAKKNQKQPAATPAETNDSCEVLFEGPPCKKTTKWDEYVKNSTLVNGEKGGWENPCEIPIGKAKNANVTKQFLVDNGFDELQGGTVYYPVDEFVRPFEVNLTRCCLSANVCIALPSSAPSSQSKVMSITVLNFLRWFPRSRALLVTGSTTEWAEGLRLVGVQNSQITTMSTSSKKADSRRVVICPTPQSAKKFVDSEKEKSEEIRLLILDMKSNECCNKHKPILSSLLTRDISFRCIVLTTSVVNTSRRTSVITKRQQMITNLQLSDWVEQSETDHAFRFSNIPPGIEVKHWKNDDLSENHRKLVENLNMENDGFWKLSESDRAIILDSPTQPHEFHGKFKFLKEIVDTFLRMNKSVRGVVLTRNDSNQQDVEKYLNMNYPNNSRQISVMTCKKVSEIVDFSTITFVISMDRESVCTIRKYQGAYLAILHEKYEKLRKDDGRIIVDDLKPTTSSSSKPQKVGALERYEFKFEPTKLRINATKMPITYYLPTKESVEEIIRRPEQNEILISSKEHQELISRMKNIDFLKYRNHRQIGELDENEVCWNQNTQYLGDVKSSEQSKKLVEYLKNEKLERSCKNKRKFEYSNDVTNYQHVEFLDSLIRKIDDLLVNSL